MTISSLLTAEKLGMMENARAQNELKRLQRLYQAMGEYMETIRHQTPKAQIAWVLGVVGHSSLKCRIKSHGKSIKVEIFEGENPERFEKLKELTGFSVDYTQPKNSLSQILTQLVSRPEKPIEVDAKYLFTGKEWEEHSEALREPQQVPATR